MWFHYLVTRKLARVPWICVQAWLFIIVRYMGNHACAKR